MKSALYVLVLSLTLSNINAQKTYDARINEKEILTPAPNKGPKIDGPKIYGVRPGKKFVCRIPCQGERPIEFKVKGLSKGLILDSEKGIISGVVPLEIGQNKMIFVAENEHGKDSCQLKLIIGDKIALTPPTGWNSLGGQMLTVTDETIRKAADVFVENGFADVGFQYISIDDCWMKIRESDFKTRPEIQEFRILVDRASIEIFCNGGEKALFLPIAMDRENKYLEFSTNGRTAKI